MAKRFNKHPTPKNEVYTYIAHRGIVSKAELLKRFSLTSSSMTRLLEEMISEKRIEEQGLGSSTGGRRPILYQTNRTFGYLLGLEISRIYSSIGLYDMHMNRLSVARWKMDERMTPEALLVHVTATIAAFMEEHGISHDQILGMGVGAVGPLDRESGIILAPLYFPAAGWRDLPICDLLEEALGFPVLLDNGAHTALIGEHWALRSESYQHMLYVHVGAGLRSAVMSNGQLVYGATDTEGAIGQMIIQTDGPRLHEHGNYGALEAFVSVQALESQVRAASATGGEAFRRRSDDGAELLTFEQMLQALSEGDAYVLGKFNEAATYLGIGLANLINVLHPEQVILGGALLNAHETVFDTAVRIAKRNTYYYPQYEPHFSKGILKEEAVAAGAAVMVLKELPM